MPRTTQPNAPIGWAYSPTARGRFDYGPSAEFLSRWGPRGRLAQRERAALAADATLDRRDRHDRHVAYDWAFGPTVEQRAARLGAEHGLRAGAWIIDGNTTPESARAILRGIEEGDPFILDNLPIVPDLTGEWADRPSGTAIYFEITEADEIGDDFTDVLDIYEQAYTDAAVAEIERSARAMVED